MTGTGSDATASARAVITTAIVTCALAACGSAPPAVPVPQLVARINAICASYAEKIEAVVPPSFPPASATAAELGTAAQYLSRTVPLLQSERSSIQAAGTPTADTSLYDSMLSALGTHVHDEQRAEAAAQAGDLSSFRAAFRADQAATTRLSGAAQQFGVTACLSS